MRARRRSSTVSGPLLLLLVAGCFTGRAMRTPEDALREPLEPLTPEAQVEATRLIEQDPDGPETGRARYLLMRQAHVEGRTGDVIAWHKEIARREQDRPWLAPATMLLILHGRSTEGALRRLERLDEALARFGNDPGFTEAAEPMIQPVVDECDRSDLETFLADSPDGPAAPYALLGLGVLHRREGRLEEANRVLHRIIVDHPDSRPARLADKLVQELSRSIPVNPRLIGVLLPETSRMATHGRSVRHGIELALMEFAAAGETFEMDYRDSGRTPEEALDALAELLNERRVIAVLGPVFSGPALLCAAEANLAGVVMLSPSAQDRKLTRTGPYVFRSTMTLDQQAQGIARFAVRVRGLSRFGVLAPDSAYGRTLTRAFSLEVAAIGGTVVASSTVEPGTSDFGHAIIDLGGVDIGGRKEAEQEFRRMTHVELELFFTKFFGAIGELPATTRVACILLTSERFTNELGQRLRAAALPHKTIAVQPPLSATDFSTYLTRADVTSTSGISGPEELALAELLAVQADEHDASLAVLISASPSSETDEAEYLQCILAMYETHTATQLAKHTFIAKRPRPPKGNRHDLDALYIPVDGEMLLQIVPQLVYHDLGLTILGSDTWNDQALQRKPEAVSLESYFTVGFWPALNRPRTRSFTGRYRRQYAALPDSLSASAYDAARLLLEAVRKSDGTREGVRRSLARAKPMDGLAGALTMTETREARRDPVILRIVDGSFVPVDEIE